MNKKQKTMLYRIIIAAVLVAAVTVLEKILELNVWIAAVLYMVPYFVIGYDILKKAWKGILKRQVFDENFLMAVATVGAIALGEFREGVAVMLFYQIGELFQSVAVGKSRKNIAALMDIRPDYANIVVDGQIEKVDPDEVEIGTIIVVNPGEKVPIDGIIIEGNTSLNTSALTGESVPRDAACGTMGVTVARMGARRSGSIPKVPPGPRMIGSMGSLPPSVTVVWSGPRSMSKGARGRGFSTCTGAGSD